MNESITRRDVLRTLGIGVAGGSVLRVIPAEAAALVKEAFERRGYVYRRADGLSLLMHQVGEAIQHADRGETAKYLHELEDVVSIAYQYIMAENLSPELADALVVERIQAKVLPGVADGSITQKYRLREAPR